MAILSKFVIDLGDKIGSAPALAVTRGLYSAAILAYIANIAIPAYKERQRKKKEKPQKTTSKDASEDEDDKAVRALARQVSVQAAKKSGRPAGPAVNKYNYHLFVL